MKETLICVDVETAGPNPGTLSMLPIDACLIEDPTNGFCGELTPGGADAQ